MSAAIRRELYFKLQSLARIPTRSNIYNDLIRQDPFSDAIRAARSRLTRLLAHCERHVPYYSDLISQTEGSYLHEPESFLQQFPILTKATVRSHFERLTSSDIDRRQWRYNSSGGSTGEPLQFIQDREFSATCMATMMLNYEWTGRSIGEPAVYLGV